MRSRSCDVAEEGRSDPSLEKHFIVKRILWSTCVPEHEGTGHVFRLKRETKGDKQYKIIVRYAMNQMFPTRAVALALGARTLVRTPTRPVAASLLVYGTRTNSSGTAPHKKSILGSLLHGNQGRDREFDEDHFATSQSAAASRGKYVHELLIHNVKPEAYDAYQALIAEYFPRLSNNPEYKMKLFGSWSTEIGIVDQCVHIWQYDNYPGYDESMSLRAKDPSHLAFMKSLRPMVTSRENQMMLEFDFWYTSEPQKYGGIYELRTYNLKPGRLLEWKNEWQKGIHARKKFVRPVGAWFSQIGDLHVVHHMWHYPNLAARKEMREKAWEIEGWNKTSYNTTRMQQSMHCRIMRPFLFSPMG